MASSTKIVWHPCAKDELREILEFYNNRNGNTEYSDWLFSNIEHRLLLAGEDRQIGEKVNEDNVRRTGVEHFIIHFLITSDSVNVLSIRDGRRRPKQFKMPKEPTTKPDA